MDSQSGSAFSQLCEDSQLSLSLSGLLHLLVIVQCWVMKSKAQCIQNPIAQCLTHYKLSATFFPNTCASGSLAYQFFSWSYFCTRLYDLKAAFKEDEVRNTLPFMPHHLPLNSWCLCKLRIALFMLNPKLNTSYVAFDE